MPQIVVLSCFFPKKPSFVCECGGGGGGGGGG